MIFLHRHYPPARATLGLFLRLLWKRPVIEGTEFIPPGAAILAPVHRHYTDPLILTLVTHRPITFMATSDLFSHKLLASLLPQLGAFPINNTKPDRKGLQTSLQALEAGNLLGLFPEGHLGKGTTLDPLMPGAAYLAISAQVPIVPIGIGSPQNEYSSLVLPRYHGALHLVVHPPIQPPAIYTRANITAMTEALRASLQEAYIKSN